MTQSDSLITEVNILSDLRIVHDQSKKSQQQNHYKSVPRFADNFYTLATLLQDCEINGLHVKRISPTFLSCDGLHS